MRAPALIAKSGPLPARWPLERRRKTAKQFVTDLSRSAAQNTWRAGQVDLEGRRAQAGAWRRGRRVRQGRGALAAEQARVQAT
eukprot:5102299-Pyramimonas_sp.AAC.1